MNGLCMSVSVRPVGGLCELSHQCDSGDSGALAGSGNLVGGRRKLLDGRCQNVTKPHKQGLVPSQLTGRAERKTNRQANMADRQTAGGVTDTPMSNKCDLKKIDFKKLSWSTPKLFFSLVLLMFSLHLSVTLCLSLSLRTM